MQMLKQHLRIDILFISWKVWEKGEKQFTETLLAVVLRHLLLSFVLHNWSQTLQCVFSCLEMLHYRRAWRTLLQNWGNRNIVNSFVYVTEEDASIYFLCTTWIIPWMLLGNCLQANFIGLEMCLYFKSQIDTLRQEMQKKLICCHTWKNIQQFNPRRCWNPNTMEYAWSWWDMFLLDFGVKFTHSLSDKFINSL